MVMVTVDSKTNLNSIGSSAERASGYYVEATASADQSFKQRTANQSSSALDAFVVKVNNLSAYVFSIYPNLLTVLSKSISTYTGALEGEGFSGDIIYTSDRGIQNIKNWLTTQRYNSIETKETKIDGKITGAKTALAMEPKSVEISSEDGKISSEASEKLKTLAEARQTKHDNLITEMRSFRDQLDTLEVDLVNVTNYLNNAMYLSQVSPGTFLNWITSGKLTAENMDYIDAIQDKGDEKMLDVLLNEEENKAAFLAKLGTVDSTHVSQMMMDKTYQKILENADADIVSEKNSEGETVNIPINLKAFFDTLSEQEKDKAKIYLEKLSISGTRIAATLSASALEKMPEFTGDHEKYKKEMDALKNSGELIPLNSTLERMGNLSSLFDSAAVLGIGHYTKMVNGRPNMMVNRMFNLTSNSDGSYTWDKVIYKKKGATDDSFVEEGREKITSKYTTSGLESAGSEAYQEYKALQEKKKDAVKELFKNAFIGGTSLISPEFSGVLSVASDISGINNVSSGLSAAKNVMGSDAKPVLKKGVVGTQKIFKFVESLYSISKEEVKNSKKFDRTLFDGGGSFYDATKSKGGSSVDMTYDLQAILQSHDMEENGLRSYIFREYGEEVLETFDQQIKSVPTNDKQSNFWDDIQSSINPDKGDSTKEAYMTSDTRDFLAGKSDKTISEVGEPNIWEGLENISRVAKEDYGMNYKSNSDVHNWRESYLANNTEYYNKLVGK